MSDAKYDEANNPQNSMLVFDPNPAGQNGTQCLRPRCRKISAVVRAAAALLNGTSSPAAQLIWAAGNTNNGATIDSARGNCDLGTTNSNWNTKSGLITRWVAAAFSR